MTLSIPLSPETEAKLRERAAAARKDPTTYAAEVLERAIARPSLDELLAPLRREFADSGTSDEELVRQITETRDAYRDDR